MPLREPIRTSVSHSGKSNFDRIARTGTSAQTFPEIAAYIAIRDRLLEDAERTRSDSMLDRVQSANEFVTSCLKPARSPYEAQHLPEADAVRERQRCEAVKVRIERLRATLAHAA